MSRHSRKFATVKRYYDRGLWLAHHVADAVAKGWVTEAEYEEIVGGPYGGGD